MIKYNEFIFWKKITISELIDNFDKNKLNQIIIKNINFFWTR